MSLQNKTPTDKRGKSRGGNVKPGEICVRIHNHISKFEVKETHYSGEPKKFLYARLTIKKIIYDMFIIDNRDLKDEVKYTTFSTILFQGKLWIFFVLAGLG